MRPWAPRLFAVAALAAAVALITALAVGDPHLVRRCGAVDYERFRRDEHEASARLRIAHQIVRCHALRDVSRSRAILLLGHGSVGAESVTWVLGQPYGAALDDDVLVVSYEDGPRRPTRVAIAST